MLCLLCIILGAFVRFMRMLNSDVFESSRVLKKAGPMRINEGPMTPLLVMARNHELPADLPSSLVKRLATRSSVH
jgi:hypothetical protein